VRWLRRLSATAALAAALVLSAASGAAALTPAVRPTTGLCLPVIGCDPGGSLVTDGAKAAAQAVFDQVSKWIADGTATLLDRVATEITRTTSVDLNAGWFTNEFAVMRTMAEFVLLPMLLVAAVSAIIRQDAGRLLRAVVVQLPLAVVGTAVAVELIDRALQITDILSEQVSSSLGTNAHAALQGMSHAIVTISASGTPGGFVLTIGALLLAFGSMLVWIELLVRASAIYVSVFFLPLVLCGLLWPATARWTRRMVELLTSLILSKFVVVAVLSLAAGALSSGDSLNAVLAGAALLLLAAFAPFVLLRLVPLVEAGVIAHLEGIERRPVAAGRSAASHAVSLAMGAAGQGATVSTTQVGSSGSSHSGSLPAAVATRLPPSAASDSNHQASDSQPPAGQPPGGQPPAGHPPAGQPPAGHPPRSGPGGQGQGDSAAGRIPGSRNGPAE
jgi:type IV secretion system protein TrbL